MGGFAPVYDSDETAILTDAQKIKLRREIWNVLNHDETIRRLIKKKTQRLYKSLSKGKKPRPRPT